MFADTGLKQYDSGKKSCYCGVVAGFAVSAVPSGRVGELTFETTATNGFNSVRDALIHEKFDGFKVATAMPREQFVEISVRFFADPSVGDWESAATQIAAMFRKFWYLPKENCCYCHKKGCDSTARCRGAYRVVHRECVEAAVEKAVSRTRGREGWGPTIAAAVGALAVLIMNIVVLLVAHTTYSLIYVFGTYLAWAGYTFTHGASGKKSALTAAGFSLLFTVLSELAAAIISGTGLAAYFSQPRYILFALGFWAIGTAVVAPKMLKSSASIEAEQRKTLDTVLPLELIEDDTAAAAPAEPDEVK